MQVTQTNADGLKRDYKVVVPSADLATKIAGKLDTLRQRVQLPGFVDRHPEEEAVGRDLRAVREQRGPPHLDPLAHVDARGDLVVVLVGQRLEPLREGALLAPGDEPVVHRLDAPAREPGRPVELEGLPRLTRLRVPRRVAGAVERELADLVHPEVVGVGVHAVGAVAHDHVRPLGPHQGHQAAHRLVEIGVGEVLRVRVGLGAGHAGVAVPEEVQLVVADDADAVVELACDLDEADPERAEASYRQVIAQAPQHADAHINLGRILHERGELTSAEEHYRCALAIRPSDPTASFNLGVVLEDGGHHAEALEAYQRAIANDARNADAHYNAARLYDLMGDYASALRHLRICRDLARRQR